MTERILACTIKKAQHTLLQLAVYGIMTILGLAFAGLLFYILTNQQAWDWLANELSAIFGAPISALLSAISVVGPPLYRFFLSIAMHLTFLGIVPWWGWLIIEGIASIFLYSFVRCLNREVGDAYTDEDNWCSLIFGACGAALGVANGILVIVSLAGWVTGIPQAWLWFIMISTLIYVLVISVGSLFVGWCFWCIGNYLYENRDTSE